MEQESNHLNKSHEPVPVLTYNELVTAQRNYFSTKVTLPYEFRLAQLKKLLALVLQYEEKILHALYLDLHKSEFEAWGVEAGLIQTDLKYAISHLHKWMRNENLRTPIFHFYAKSYIQKIPYGVTLVIGPWNYPFLLALRPAIGAIAAGNTCIIKPGETSVQTAEILEEIINNHFPQEYLHVINTNAAGTQNLLKEKFDYIFFTGGTFVGKLVYEAAAKHLTPVSLELGGKNPCVIEADANVKITASRIAWGKFSNAGQTCVAPDYLLVHRSVKDQLVELIISNIKLFFGDDASLSKDFGRIINDHHLSRIEKLFEGVKILYGGNVNQKEKYISPTIVEILNLQSPIMQEEIFGPILPIITYDSVEEIFEIIHRNPDPLVFYIFTQNKKLINKFAREISCGDMVVNEVVLHFGHLKFPIGGKGTSGIGKYQGKYSFDEFSHKKSVMHKSYFPELNVRYPPYTSKKLNFLKWLFKWLMNR